MKKIISILLSCILGATLFVGCGDKKETIKEPQKQEQQISSDQENKIVKSVNLKDTEYYKYLKQMANTEVVEFKENTSQKGTKSIDIVINIKDTNDEKMVKEFFKDIIHISGFIDSTYKDKNFDILTISDKKLGMVMYMHDDDKGGLLTLQSVVMEPKYEKIFNKEKEEFLKKNNQ